jgi:phosphoribosylglycinamide formyltransferase-1
MVGRRTAVLISGGGSNLQALIDAAAAGRSAAEIALVVSNRPDAYGLERAERNGIASTVVDHRGFPSRAAFEAVLDSQLRDAEIELVCLAGFMRVLTNGFVEAWRNRLLNIHPSLLPAFPGLDTHVRALRAGCRVHGCTVHLVRPTLDDGPILVQGVVPVLADDDAARLAARVLEVEHRCYPLALDLMAGGDLCIDGDRVTLPAGVDPLVLHPALGDHALQP